MVLRNLLREVWRAWNHSELAIDPARQIIDLAKIGQPGQAFALARAHEHDEIAWEEIAREFQTYGKEVERLLYLCLHRASDPAHVLLALGHWFAVNGEPLRACQCAQELHRLQPQEPSPLTLLGNLHLALGNPRAASRNFLAAIHRDEGNREAFLGYQAAMRQCPGGLPATALPQESLEAELRQRIEAMPGNFENYLALGKHYALSSRNALGLPYLRAAHQLAPENPEATYWLAWTLAGLNNDQSALAVASAGLAQTSGRADLLKLAAECAARLGQEARAIAWLREIAVDGETDATIFNNLGDCLNRIEHFDEAIPLLYKAVSLDPSMTEARHNLAYALYCTGRYEDAKVHLDVLLEYDKNDFSAHWYRSTTLLAAHDFRSGWEDYEYRFVAGVVDGRLIPLPAWRGEPLAGKKIVVVAEQGIGDEIMFASCIPDLLEQAESCVIECNQRLVGLFQRSFPEAIVVAWAGSPLPVWLEQHRDADCHVQCGSLPLHYRNSLASFRGRSPYLVADAAQTARLRQRIASLGPGLKIGIAWQGGGNASRTRTRSLRLEQLDPLFAVPGCQFISLQYGEVTETVARHNLDRQSPLHHWPEVIADLDAFASLVEALDLVVTVCSAPVHFAGGLGKPVLVLTPFAPEWRYRGIAGKMVWYPGVRLIPQQAIDDWSGAIETVADLVAAQSSSHAA